LFPSRTGISADIRTKIESHDSDVFQGMDQREFKKLTPDIIAAAGVGIDYRMPCDELVKTWFIPVPSVLNLETLLSLFNV
jgi:hypothetical protein